MTLTTIPIKKCTISALALLLYTCSFAQVKHGEFVSEDKMKARKAQSHVVMVNTTVLNNIMSKCVENGIENVKLVFVKIRKDDIANYLENHPDAKGFEGQLLDKLTVLIKIEGDNIDENSFAITPNGKGSTTGSLADAGFIKVHKPYGGIPMVKGVVYLEVGSICPPPNSCN